MRSLISYSESSNFTIHNIPFGVATFPDGSKSVVSAIGDYVIRLEKLYERDLFNADILGKDNIFGNEFLNPFMELGKAARVHVRNELQKYLSGQEGDLSVDSTDFSTVFVPLTDVTMNLPVKIGDYTDFYSSREHATNVGTMFRGKDNALQPNWLHLPVGYHGRASSVVVSGTPVHRPMGQTKADDAEMPSFGPCRLMDFELEMGFFVSQGNDLGSSISIREAEDHIFGMVVVNDWSARDIQKWEYVPLGPFLAKNFGTSISPWVITMEALEPFRVKSPVQDNPPVLPYLQHRHDSSFDIELGVWIQPEGSEQEYKVCSSNFKYLYWSMAQQLSHHSVTGCNMQTGDLLASGTISGPTPDSYGSMLELTWRGQNPIELGDGSQRKFLADGDTVIMRAFSQKGDIRVGFGEVRSKILPAKS